MKTSTKSETVQSRASMDYGLLSKVLMFWGLATAVQGILIAYSMTTQIFLGVKGGVIEPISLAAFPYELNALGGILNLLFGVTLVALGKKMKDW
ncbi:Uncharacterised protein [uncultured archaeon]|nr:Uncharacterised protein [uncultured archaeon]